MPNALVIVNQIYLALAALAFIGSMTNKGGSYIYLLLCLATGLVVLASKKNTKPLFISALVANVIACLLVIAWLVTALLSSRMPYFIPLIAILIYSPLFLSTYFLFDAVKYFDDKSERGR
jgi:CHASE2 domain-containing sensor protein